MNNQSLNSISFVISAVYTVTFANTVYLMTVNDPSQSFSLNNMVWMTDRIICGIISLVMTLRFFFGNNQFISDIMLNTSKSPWLKFYHFCFIALQSMVLLICSYNVQDRVNFVYGIISLFGIELIWYILTFIVDKKSVWADKPEERIPFFYAQLSNLGFVIGVLLISTFFSHYNLIWLWVVFLLFLINTIIDLIKNMPTYMS